MNPTHLLNQGLGKLRSFLKLLQREKIPFILKLILGFAIVSSSLILVLEGLNPESNIVSLLDAVWWSFVTMTTVGYGDHYPTTAGGRILGVLMMFSGIAISSFFTATIASRFVDRRLKEGRGLETVTSTNHLVICGWNQECTQLLTILEGNQEWSEEGEIVLILDAAEEKFYEIQDEFPSMSLKFVSGKYTSDVALKRAQVAKARMVIILGLEELEPSASDDAVVRATYAIKSMNNRVKVLAELNHRKNVAHLQRANVDEIVVKGEFLGFLMGNATCSPGVSNVIRELLDVRTGENLVQEVIPGHLVGGTFKDLFNTFRSKNQSIVLGVITRVEPLGLEDILGSD
ncbi:hypothetical protein HOF92_05930, partial [bacterium]|nr:hypothetical protein [bacterium]